MREERSVGGKNPIKTIDGKWSERSMCEVQRRDG